MTAQIADALEEHLQPKGVMVMIEAGTYVYDHAAVFRNQAAKL